MKGWISVSSDRYAKFEEEQKNKRKKIAELLAMYMIRRDENSNIRGKRVMIDYFKLCTRLEAPLIPSDNDAEVMEREKVYMDATS